MAKQINILNRQTPLDIAIQEYGTPEAAFDMMMMNSSITAELVAGSEVKIKDGIIEDTEVKNYYQKHQIKPISVMKDIQGAFSNGFSNGYNI